jgi:diaminopimelate decarboxylase
VSSLSFARSLKRAVTSAVVHSLARRDRATQAAATQAYDGLEPALWNCRVDSAGRLTWDGHALPEVVQRFGSPLHVVSQARLIHNVESFLAPFVSVYPNVGLASSYKTNPLPGVLEILHNAGTSAEVISHFEFWLARRLGLPGRSILFNGPGKTPEAISDAVQAGVRLINIDGPQEIPWIAQAAAATGTAQSVGLRVVTSVGWSGQFGFQINSQSVMNACRAISADSRLKLSGLHLHLGTGIKDLFTYATAVEEVLQFGRRLRDELGVTIQTYDLGGGFGVPTVRTRSAWDDRLVAHGYPPRPATPDECPSPTDYAAKLIPLIERYQLQGEAPPEILFEPGRAITSSAQILLLKVLAVKIDDEGRQTLILDGGKNLTLPLEWETHQIFAVSRMNEPHDQVYDLCGPLCHPGDILAKQKRLPRLHPGDLLAVMDAGAYFIPNQLNFSLPRPAVVLLEGRHVRCLRSREQFEDIVRLDQFSKHAAES